VRKTALPILLALFITVVPTSPARHLAIVPTTSVAAETSNNTSAADTFKSQSNGNVGAGNISKLDIHSLLYPGAHTKIIAHLMPWFGKSYHMNVGYISDTPEQVHKQVTDMISRGVNGVIIDWYGAAATTYDHFTKLLMAEAEAHPGFFFAVQVDKGAISSHPCQGCTPQQSLIYHMQYVAQTYFSSPAYWRINGHPMLTTYDMDRHYPGLDWNAVAAAVPGNPVYIFQDYAGFDHTVTSGSFAWAVPTDKTFGMNYLRKFYTAALAHPDETPIGANYKGFNDTLASWGLNRIMSQQCGQTWLMTFDKINSYYNSSKELDALQLVTWNDYEEGTELETGIDNCLTISASLAANSLQWNITGQENTLDHYRIFISTDGQNLMELATAPTGSNSLNLVSYDLAPGTYTFYVQAVGKPVIVNHLSNAVQYTVKGTSSGGGLPPNAPPSFTLTAQSASLQLRRGGSVSTRINIAGSAGDTQVSLSCSNLPAGFTCKFMPATLRAGSATTLTISSSRLAQSRSQSHTNLFWAISLPGFGFAAMLVIGPVDRKRLRRLAGITLLLCVSVLFTGCGSGAGTNPVSARTAADTAGTSFSVSVDATSGTMRSSTILNVKVI
jgi:hypothetical protein